MNAASIIVTKLLGGYVEEAVDDVYTLIDRIAALEAEVREKNAWEGRYRALLEEAEASRPPEIDGGDASRGASRGVIAIDRDGRPWVCGNGFWWELIKNPDRGARELPEKYGPYTLAYIPRGGIVKFDERPTFPEPPSWRAVAETTMFSTDDGDPTAEARVCALLEIADQMRVANLIALVKVLSHETEASKHISPRRVAIRITQAKTREYEQLPRKEKKWLQGPNLK